MTDRRRGQTVVTLLGSATKLTQAPSAPTHVRLSTTAKAASPHALARHLEDLEKRFAASQRPNLFSDGVAHRGLKVTAATTFYVQHRLGRPYVGYYVTRIQNPSAAPTLWEVALPGNYTPDKWVAFQTTTFTGTLDVYIF